MTPWTVRDMWQVMLNLREMYVRRYGKKVADELAARRIWAKGDKSWPRNG